MVYAISMCCLFQYRELCVLHSDFTMRRSLAISGGGRRFPAGHGRHRRASSITAFALHVGLDDAADVADYSFAERALPGRGAFRDFAEFLWLLDMSARRRESRRHFARAEAARRQAMRFSAFTASLSTSSRPFASRQDMSRAMSITPFATCRWRSDMAVVSDVSFYRLLDGSAPSAKMLGVMSFDSDAS